VFCNLLPVAIENIGLFRVDCCRAPLDALLHISCWFIWWLASLDHKSTHVLHAAMDHHEDNWAHSADYEESTKLVSIFATRSE
jgi:hypothetical protein